MHWKVRLCKKKKGQRSEFLSLNSEKGKNALNTPFTCAEGTQVSIFAWDRMRKHVFVNSHG